ncbi:MAG: hypothetical protein WA417_16825 [Stellaceae bacterium]
MKQRLSRRNNIKPRNREFEFEIDLTFVRIVVHAANDIVAADIVHAMTPHELVAAAKGTLKHRVGIVRIEGGE